MHDIRTATDPRPNSDTAVELDQMRRRLSAVEARIAQGQAKASAGVLAGRFLAGMSGVAAAALVVIAASMVWQAAYPPATGQPVVLRPPSGDASAQSPAFRLPDPFRPGPRG